MGSRPRLSSLRSLVLVLILSTVARAESKADPAQLMERARTDEKGRARITGLNAGAIDMVSADAEGYVQGILEDVRLEADRTVELRLTPLAILRGTISYEDGLPAGAVKVVAYKLVPGEKDDYEGAVYADTAGRFTMKLDPGRYRIVFKTPGANWKAEGASRHVELVGGQESAFTFRIARTR